MSDGFEVVFDDNFMQLRQRLLTFGDKITTVVTKAALKEGAFLMRDSARGYVHDSHKFLADAMLFEHKPFYVYDAQQHWLGGKNSTQYTLIKAGNLRRHIRAGVMKKRFLLEGELGYRVFASSKVSWYAKFVEFGTSNMAAKPFMRPAYEANYQDISFIFKRHIQHAVDGGI